MTSRNRPEIALLLYCARRRLNNEADVELQPLIEQIEDWERLLKISSRHLMMPLLYWHLRCAPAGIVPVAFMDRLRDYFHRNVARNLQLTAELCKLLRLFEENGIKAIPYKGPALALSLYGDTAFRQFSDLDLLIGKQDIVKATDLLASIGYRSPYTLNSKREASYLRSKREQLFTHPGGRVYVEIHWAFAPKPLAPSLDAERFCPRLEETSLNGIRTYALSTEDLLLILCVHGGKHRWERLAWLCDIAELIVAHPNMAWERLLEEAGVVGVRRMLLLGLLLVNDLLDVALPEVIRKEITADTTISALAAYVRRNLFAEASSPPGTAESLFFNYKIRERRWDAARYCYYMTVPPTPAEWMAVDLPTNLSFLYYLVRPARLIKKHTSLGLKRFFRV
ncbi:MAG TPA: nucleotidyltransferase family protein [Pyrinomonadaceae bacterium]